MRQELKRYPADQIRSIWAFVAGARAMLDKMPNQSGNDPMKIEVEHRADTGECLIYLATGRWELINGEVCQVFGNVAFTSSQNK